MVVFVAIKTKFSSRLICLSAAATDNDYIVRLPRRISTRELVVAFIVVVKPLSLSFQSIERAIDSLGVKIDEQIAPPCV